MNVIHWSLTCSLGAIVGSVKVEAEAGAARIAELVIQGTATAGQAITLTYTPGGLLFEGVVDEAANLGNGLTQLTCTDGLVQDINAMTRSQIDTLIGSRWHSSLTDDETQGWEYAEDRQQTLFGFLRKLPGGTPEVVHWQSGSISVPSQSQMIEDSYSSTTPAWRDLTRRITLTLEYRYPTFEQATANYSWTGGGGGWWSNARWPIVADQTWKNYYDRIKDDNARKLASTRPQAHEIYQLMAGTGWLIANMDGAGVASWVGGVPGTAEVYSSETTVDIDSGSATAEDKAVVNISPAVASFASTLVNRYQSTVNINGTLDIALGENGNHQHESARYVVEPLLVTDTTGQPFNAVLFNWRTQLGEPPQINWRDDFDDFVAARADASVKKMLIGYRGKTISYKIPCNPTIHPDGRITRVLHELDADAGWATTEVTGVNGAPSASPTNRISSLTPLRQREAGPVYSLGTHTITGHDNPPKQPGPDFYGLVRTVNGTIMTGSGSIPAIIPSITNAARNSFTIQSPEYSDTGPRERQIIDTEWRY